MTPTLRRASLRFLARHPWQLALSVVGIALGVAVVLSIDLANESARRSFALFTEAVAGRATHQIVGGPTGLPEDLYRRLRVEAGIRQSAPVVERTVAVPDHAGTTFHLMGVDPLAEAPFRSVVTAAAGSVRDLSALLTRPATALIARDTARRLGLGPGDALVVRVGAERRRVVLAGELIPADELSAQAIEWLLVTDLSTAQELTGSVGRLSRIDLIVPSGDAGAQMLARVRAFLPAGAEIVAADARSQAVEQMTRAFRINLTALSLLALVVGVFLIYNTMTFSVVQRRELIGMLRAVGVARREIFLVVLGEALGLGVIATAAGLPLGIVLGSGLVRLVTRTINDLYVTLAVGGLAVPALALAKATALGVAGTVVAALPAALEATATPPRAVLTRSTIETRSRRAVPRLAVAGVLSIAGGAALLGFGPSGLGAAYAGLFAAIVGAALLTPATAVALVALLGPLLGRIFGLAGRMAARAVVQALSRTGVALAALMIAIATTVGVGVMIGSFRQTVVAWLTTSLQADVYVSPPSLQSNRQDSTLDPGLVARLRTAPGVGHVASLRSARVQSPEGPVQLLAVDTEGRGYRGFAFKSGDPPTVRRALGAGAVVVSEPFAARRRLGVGSTVRLQTDRGERSFTVAGVYYDYSSSEGLVLMSRITYERLWDDPGMSALGVYAAPGVRVDTLLASLRRAAGPEEEVLIRDARALREASLAVFDRTFAVTVVLRALATVVAFVGVLSALSALGLERQRETAILRAQGFTPREVRTLVIAQTGLMGFVAGLLALPVGVALAAVLVFVINQRSFGWTLMLTVSPAVLVQALGLAVGAAILAGLYPARRIARLPLPVALRDE